MLSLRALFIVATTLYASGVVDATEPVPLEAMALDDECDADATCALNALQVRAATGIFSATPAPEMQECPGSMPEGWNSDTDFPEDLDAAAVLKEAGDDAAATTGDEEADDEVAPSADADAADADAAAPAASGASEAAEDNASAEDAAASSEEATTTEVATTTEAKTTTTTQKRYFDSVCAHDAQSHGCFLYRHCVKVASGQGHANPDNKYCVMSGYTVVPAFPITGTESINVRNSMHVDPIMDAAYEKCSSSKCVLMVNPRGHRTQEQLYIHYRHYNNGGGSRLKTQLETTACYQSGWHKVHGIPELHKCKSAQVRVYSQHPTDIFSQVAEAQGKHGKKSLDGVGVTVYPRACPRSKKTMVLFTEHCTIEKSISKGR